jgi:adenine/guanine phosphoribosyltransferase-like PRPP-binding protein
MDIRTSYLTSAFDMELQRKVIHKAIEKLRPRVDDFDVIAFSGMSGALIAPIIAHGLGKGMLLVRKSLDNSHANCVLEGVSSGRYIILDDFIASGSTIRYIKNSIAEKGSGLEFTAIYLYNGWRSIGMHSEAMLTVEFGPFWNDWEQVKKDENQN